MDRQYDDVASGIEFERFHVQESRLEDLSAHSSPEGEAMRTILRKHSEIAQKI